MQTRIIFRPSVCCTNVKRLPIIFFANVCNGKHQSQDSWVRSWDTNFKPRPQFIKISESSKMAQTGNCMFYDFLPTLTANKDIKPELD